MNLNTLKIPLYEISNNIINIHIGSVKKLQVSANLLNQEMLKY